MQCMYFLHYINNYDNIEKRVIEKNRVLFSIFKISRKIFMATPSAKKFWSSVNINLWSV